MGSLTGEISPYQLSSPSHKLGTNLAIRARNQAQGIDEEIAIVEDDVALGVILADELETAINMAVTEQQAQRQPAYKWAMKRFKGRGELIWKVGTREVCQKLLGD